MQVRRPRSNFAERLPSAKLARVAQRDQQHCEHQAGRRNRRQLRGKRGVGELREAADQDILRVAGDRCGAADIGRHRHRQQAGHRVAPQPQGDVKDERHHHQADRVVQQEGGKGAAGEDHGGEQLQRVMGARHDPAGDQPEKAGQPQVGDDDHHAEQQRDGVEIDRARHLVDVEAAERQHQAGTDQRRAGAVEPETGQPADCDDDVGDGKDLDDRGARRDSRGRLIPGDRRRRGERDHRDGAADPGPPAGLAASCNCAERYQRLLRSRNSRPALTIGSPS